MCYKIIKHDVAVPNSDVYTRLDSEVQYIAIERESMQYAYITELEANSLQINKDYLLRKKIIYHEDNRDCITAIYLNNHTSIREYCKYSILPKNTKPQVTQYDDSKFYLRNTKDYTVQCSIGNIYKGHTNDYIQRYTCLEFCLIEVDNIHPTINETSGDWTTNCILQTEAWTLHFKPTDTLKTSQGPRYLINLPVLASQYSDEQIRHLDSHTELKTRASTDMPKIKITYHEGDPLFNIRQDTLLNQTDSDKAVFASVYRDPDFINRFVKNTEYGVTEWACLAMAILSFIGIIYLLKK